jgi:O-antigen/teichoic acid export membrane protein
VANSGTGDIGFKPLHLLEDLYSNVPSLNLCAMVHSATIEGKHSRSEAKALRVSWISVNRILGWMRLFIEYSLSQGFGQAAGLLTGFVLVHTMPVDEYAIYALYLSALGFIGVSTDLGATGSLVYFRRRCMRTGNDYGPYIAAVRWIRVGLLLVAGSSFVAFLLIGFLKTITWVDALFGCSLVLLIAWAQTRAAINLTLLRLEGNFRPSYYSEATGSLFRLGAAIAMVLTKITAAWFALFGTLLGSLAVLGCTAFFSGTNLARTMGRPSWSTYRDVFRYVLPIVPGALVFSVQDIAILWIAAKVSGKQVVAETFALGRIGAAIALLAGFVGTVMIPKLSNITDERRYSRVFVATILATLAVVTIIFIAAEIFPDLFLLLIGNQYDHLEHELGIAIAGSGVGVIGSIVVLTNRARGWVRLEPVMTGLYAVTLVVLVTNWSYQSAKDVLWLQLALGLVGLMLHLGASWLGHLDPRLTQVRTSEGS